MEAEAVDINFEYKEESCYEAIIFYGAASSSRKTTIVDLHRVGGRMVAVDSPVSPKLQFPWHVLRRAEPLGRRTGPRHRSRGTRAEDNMERPRHVERGLGGDRHVG